MAHTHGADNNECPEQLGVDCPVLVEQHAQKRRKQDSTQTQVKKFVLWLMTAAAAFGGGNWYTKNTEVLTHQGQQEVIDAKAREQIALLRVELSGKLDVINERQNQVLEAVRELKAHR